MFQPIENRMPYHDISLLLVEPELDTYLHHQELSVRKYKSNVINICYPSIGTYRNGESLCTGSPKQTCYRNF